MISVSNSSIGLGFGGIEEEMMMEDSDFEEDSIHSYVSCVDPDVALSYIDDKLENVLGHFQKDFEGGVFAENLGAKYGGYGSFLAMYQRSPVCKSPPQVQHQVVSGSKCPASLAVPQVSVSGSTSKAHPPASNVLVKLNNYVHSSNIGTPDNKQKPVTKPSSSSAPLNHKTLRLRIKVSSSEFSSPKDVSAYNSNQGLNMPPSTSRVNCLLEVEEGLLNEIHDSPSEILMAMVSFPLHKGELLSPLSDDLIQLGKKEKSKLEKVSKSETRDEDQIMKSKLPEARKSQKESSRNSSRSKDTAVNIIDTTVVDNFQEDIGGSEDVCEGFLGDSGESKEQCSLVLKAKKEKLPEENALKESLDSVRNDEEACKHLPLVCEPDSKRPIKSSYLNIDQHNTKQSVRSEVKNQHSVEGGMENLGVGSERELSGTCKKPKTGKSRFSSVDQAGPNKTLDGVNKTVVTQASAHKVKDISKASSHDGHEDRKRKQEENKESGDCTRLREAAVMESSGEKIRMKKRLKGSSCGGIELPFSNESCDRDRGRSQEDGRDLGTAVEIKTEESRSKKRPIRKVSMESNKEGSREYLDADHKLETNGSHFSSPQKSDRAKTVRGKSNHLEVTSEKLKNKLAPPAGAQVEVLGHGTEISNTKEQMMRNNGSKHKDDIDSSPLKKESTCQTASNSIKEATDLKHMADRLKNVVSNHESTSVYFQAALKFLHGAFLLESSGSIARSKDIYGSTAKLCEFCAHEYEKNKDMGAAALAYKCMEIAYLRITYCSHGIINRSRPELQSALQEIPSGESPSFASYGENPNQTLAAEQVALSNTVRSSPRVTGNHVLSSGNNSSLSQLLAFSQNVSFAMDASRKAQTAFGIAKGKSSDKGCCSNGMTSIKRALDFDFQDMEKLLHVLRLAMESINM